MNYTASTQAELEAAAKASAGRYDVITLQGDGFFYLGDTWGSSSPTIYTRGSSSPTIYTWGSSSPTIYTRGSSSPTIYTRGSSSPTIYTQGSSSPTIVDYRTVKQEVWLCAGVHYAYRVASDDHTYAEFTDEQDARAFLAELVTRREGLKVRA